MSLNKNLHQAKREKNDEFYTQLTDIEKELHHYSQHFRDKTVYCNCDDSKASQFFQYFWKKFRSLGLKKLVTTCYKNNDPESFSLHMSKDSAGLSVSKNGGRRVSHELLGTEDFPLKGDGDFRSEECIEILKQADIVVTNPPFSLLREYVAQLMEYDKRFLIVGNMNAISYKEIFPLIQSNKMWLGITPKGRDMLFDVRSEYAEELKATKKEGSAYRIVEGVIKGRLGNAAWFTNLDHKRRHEPLILYKRYNSEDYPVYDNYDAINVDKTKDIPKDYDGAMGVPISFLDKYNPEQFEILSANDLRRNKQTPIKPHGLIKDKDGSIGGQPKYVRIVIRKRNVQS